MIIFNKPLLQLLPILSKTNHGVEEKIDLATIDSKMAIITPIVILVETIAMEIADQMAIEISMDLVILKMAMQGVEIATRSLKTMIGSVALIP